MLYNLIYLLFNGFWLFFTIPFLSFLETILITSVPEPSNIHDNINSLRFSWVPLERSFAELC